MSQVGDSGEGEVSEEVTDTLLDEVMLDVAAAEQNIYDQGQSLEDIMKAEWNTLYLWFIRTLMCNEISCNQSIVFSPD